LFDLLKFLTIFDDYANIHQRYRPEMGRSCCVAMGEAE